MQETVEARAVETKTRAFISYSRQDVAFVDRLEAALTVRGFEVLIDRQEIYAFEDWWKRIEALVGRADTVVFVLSPDAVKSDVALKEVAHAASLNKRFAPIVCRRTEDAAVPETLRRLNFIFFDEPQQFEASADRLAAALCTDIGWVRQHTEYGEAERRWSAAGRPRGLLLHSPTLEVAEYWIGSRPLGAPEPTKEIRDFLAASRQGARSSQRLRRIAQGSIFGLMVAVILGLLGWINQVSIADEWRWWTLTRPYAEVQVWPHVLTAAQEQALKPGQSFKECAKDCPEMVVVPSGSFMMGAPAAESQAVWYKTQIPQHSVTIAKAFAVSKYELTFADWEACELGGGCNAYEPSPDWGRGQQPVISVSWSDAQAYATWLSEVTGKTYRLLSEAEYEYATRAGTTTVYPWGNDLEVNGRAMANCSACGSQWDGEKTAPAGSFPPNKFGLYDMVGNVWEWTEDCVHPNYNGAPTDGSAWLKDNGGYCFSRVVRGGSWTSSPDFLRSTARDGDSVGSQLNVIGFRVARTFLAP